MPRKYAKKNPRPPMREWEHFVTVSARADGIRLVVKCRYCGWQRAAHASRCASHFYRLHADRIATSSNGGSGSDSASGSGSGSGSVTSRQSVMSQFSDRCAPLPSIMA